MKQRDKIRKVETGLVIIRCQMFGGRNGQSLQFAKKLSKFIDNVDRNSI